MPHLVIVGNGSAGRSAAEAIREIDQGCEVTILTEEPVGHYYRPDLDEYVITEQPETLWTGKDSFYEANDVDLRLDCVVGALDTQAQQVTLAGGGTVAYDQLLIATGGKPIMVPWPGHDLAGIHTLRSFADAEAIVQSAREAEQAAIVGGGLLGMDFARVLRKKDRSVVHLVREPALGGPALDEKAGAIIEKRLLAEGVELCLEEEVVEWEGSDGRVAAVRTSKDRRFECQVAAVAVGVRAATAFLEGSGIETDQGILVDTHQRTSVPCVYAAGDVAQVHDFVYDQPRVHTSWRNADEQGGIAGRNMAGEEAVADNLIAWNYQEVFDLPYVSMGAALETDAPFQVLANYDPEGDLYHKLVLRDDKVVGAVLLGKTEQSFGVEQAIRLEVDISEVKDELLNEDFDWIALTMG
ncbi:MAG: NAD(P)/FAD-dependent oxidoreductase [Armatimonadota bacterium]